MSSSWGWGVAHEHSWGKWDGWKSELPFSWDTHDDSWGTHYDSWATPHSNEILMITHEELMMTHEQPPLLS